MAQEYIVLEPNKYGVVHLNKVVFSSIAKNVIEDIDNVVLADSKKVKNSITTIVDGNKLSMSVQVKVACNANVADVCSELQTKIFESISYMTDFKPESIEVSVVGFIF
ncbi:MAG: Asp23/Gls24 family envelope stress response protein [Firmicutes bacterium]|nr:Asp23/Gls24 family envelope stress response protein [Bacillota bacterium]